MNTASDEYTRRTDGMHRASDALRDERRFYEMTPRDEMSNEVAPYKEATVTPADDVSGLVSLAIREKVPVEVLERLVALQERVTERNARAAFFEAMTAFRAECPPIPKTRENSQFKVTRAGVQVAAKYAPLEDIDRISRPVAAKHGLAWTWNTSVTGDTMRIDCRVSHIDGHSEVTSVTMPCESKAGSSAQQKFGSAQTYGMRYSLVAALGLTTADDDTDGAARRDAAADETITGEQAADLQALCDEVKADPRKVLAWAGVESFETIRKGEYAAVVRALEAKRAA